MLRTRTSFPVHFPTLATRLVLQVCGSVAATLIASALVTGLPRAGVPAAPAELTSGGKFAARALDGHVEAAPAAWARQTLPVLTQVSFEQVSFEQVSFDQVSFEPFPAGPSLDAAPALAGPALVAPAPVHATSLAEAASSSEAAPRAARKPRPQPAHAERVRPPEPAPAAASQPPVTDAARDEDGLLPRVAASARSAWTFTASAGGSLLSRLVP